MQGDLILMIMMNLFSSLASNERGSNNNELFIEIRIISTDGVIITWGNVAINHGALLHYEERVHKPWF